jgi:thiamine biosynthesis lipoprotein
MIRRARPLLGTLVDIQAVGGRTVQAVEAAFSAITEVHRLMSFHEMESDVSRINRSNGLVPITVSSSTYDVLVFAEQMSKATDGAFDITVASSMVDAQLLPYPVGAGIVDRDASFRDVRLLPQNQLLLKKRLWIDLGGIAKGYAVDCAVDVLRAFGVESGLVNAGGDLRFFGLPQTIKVRHPNTPSEFINLGLLSNGAVATSAGTFSEERYSGLEPDPLVDPKSRACVRWEQSVSVFANNCMTADALTKAVRLAPHHVSKILNQFQASSFVVAREGFRTNGASEREWA